MESDDLLCSRNARSKTPLVGRAQWKINQTPSLKEVTSELGGKKGAAWSSSCSRNAHAQKVLARREISSRLFSSHRTTVMSDDEVDWEDALRYRMMVLLCHYTVVPLMEVCA